MANFLKKHKIEVILFFISLIVSLNPIHTTPLDYGHYSVLVERASEGQLVYRDFGEMYTPLRFYVPALFYKFLGVHLNTLIFYWAILNALLCVVIYRISAKIWKNRL